MKTHRTVTWLLSLMTVAVVAVGCGSDDSSGSSTTTTTTTTAAVATTGQSSTSASGTSAASGGSDAQLCAARDSLKTSVQELATSVTGIARTGTAGVQTALDKVKTDLASVKQLAKADVAPQVTATENALNALQIAVANVGSSGVMAVVPAATAFGTSATTLISSLQSLKCS